MPGALPRSVRFLCRRRAVNPDLDRRSSADAGRPGTCAVVLVPPSCVRQHDVCLHDGVEAVEVGRLGGTAVVVRLSGVRVVPAQQRAVSMGDLACRRGWRDTEDRVVVRLAVPQGRFREVAVDWAMAPGRTLQFGRGPSFREATSGAVFPLRNKRYGVARSLRPFFRCGRSDAPACALRRWPPPGRPRRSGFDYALISWRCCPLAVISMRRGLAFSATGIRSVRTPAS